MVGVSTLLNFGIITVNTNAIVAQSPSQLLALSIGAVHPYTLISGWHLPSIAGSTVVASVLIANIPQPILSFLYLLFNGVFTSMLLADEWSRFAHERKPLRVSEPKEGQRSTYFLQLPYRFAIPLMILSGVLHWSVSQSIFLSQVASFDKFGHLVNPAAISTCGYLPVAIVLTMIIGLCLTIFAFMLGYRKFQPGMPLVGSCSAAIAAACHGGEINTRAPLKWGEVNADQRKEVGHCAFSDQYVEMPREGAWYAGGIKRRRSACAYKEDCSSLSESTED
jgi:hypothetical protein